jgi:redox-sensitive bicupin YhaK (pirin superfamily)
MIEPEYLDVTVPSAAKFLRPTRQGHAVFAYVIEGGARFSEQRDQEENGMAEDRSLVLFGDGDGISVTTEERPVRFLLISGKPLREPVAWQGPIVMNTREELRTAFEEYSRGTFIKA